MESQLQGYRDDQSVKETGARKQKMKKTRFKLHKIIINNRRSTCNIYDKKNDIFNGKLYNYLNSNSFYEKNKKFHRIFHFSKNDLNIAHDFTKQSWEM